MGRRIYFNWPTYHHSLSILTFHWDKNVLWKRSSWIILGIKYFCGCFDTYVQERTVSTNYSVSSSSVMLTCFSCVSFNAGSEQSGYLCFSKSFCLLNTLTLSLLKYKKKLLSLHTKSYIFIKVNLPFCSIWRLAFSFSHSSVFVAYISQICCGSQFSPPSRTHTHTHWKNKAVLSHQGRSQGQVRTCGQMTGSQDLRPTNLDILPVIKQIIFEYKNSSPDVSFKNNSGS